MCIRDRNNIIAEYALRDVNKPIGISRYALAASLPDELKASFPTVEEVEAELGKSDLREESGKTDYSLKGLLDEQDNENP